MNSIEAPASTLPTLRLVAPGDADYDEVRAGYNRCDDLRPALIALPATEEAIADAVREARRRGLAVAVRATGHHTAAYRDLADTLLIDTRDVVGVTIDPATRRVRVSAGTTWADVTAPLAEHGLMALHGSSPGIGVVGYSLGGGLGWLARTDGLQSQRVLAVDLVDADGVARRVDATSDPELFWALRGGGGSFGVVTALEFEAVPVRELAAGPLFYDIDRAAEVLRAWDALLDHLPDETTTWVQLVNFPPDPALPDHVRGRSLVMVCVAHQGSEDDARRVLAPLLALGPAIDQLAPAGPLDLTTLSMDPPLPLPYRSTTALLDDLDAVVDDLVALAAPGGPSANLQLRHLGGALARAQQGAGVRVGLEGRLALFTLGVAFDEEMAAALERHLAAVDEVVAPVRLGAFASFVERPVDPATLVPDDDWARLRAVKRRVDPDDVVRANHHVPV